MPDNSQRGEFFYPLDHSCPDLSRDSGFAKWNCTGY
jgi:hypothetical protein